MVNENSDLAYIEYTDNNFANTFSFILEAYRNSVDLIEKFDKKTVLDIYKMTGQLRMSEEDKQAKLKVEYDKEIDIVIEKVSAKGFTMKELAQKYGSPI